MCGDKKLRSKIYLMTQRHRKRFDMGSHDEKAEPILNLMKAKMDFANLALYSAAGAT